jgi:hypothetical protein
MFTKIIPLNVLILDSRPGISFSLMKDLKDLHLVEKNNVRRFKAFDDAVRDMERDMPNVVFLRFDMPQGIAEQFFERFPARSRRFVLILLHAPSHTPREQMKIAGVLARQHVAGYLPLGHFSNEDLQETIEGARSALQFMHITDHQQDIIDAFVRSLRHPLFKLAEQNTTHNVDAFYGKGSVLHIRERTLENEHEYDISWDRVVHLHSKGNYFDVWYVDEQGEYRTTIIRKEDIEPPPALHQIHRSHRVNLAYIRRFSPTHVYLVNGDEIQMSRTERERLESILEELSLPLMVLNTIQRTLEQNIAEEKALAATALATKELTIGNVLLAGGGQDKSHKKVTRKLA